MRQFIKNGTALVFARQDNILSAASIIIATYGISHLMGFVKTWLLVRFFFNQPSLLDSYYAATIIPDAVFQLIVVGSLSAAFIPVFTRYLSKDENSAWKLASSSLNLVLIIISFVSLVIALLAPFLAKIIAPGFSPLQLASVTSLMRVMLISQLFFSVSGFLTSVIQSHQRFLIPALAPIAYNLGIILGTIFLSGSLGIFGPVTGMVIGAAAHMLLQLPLAVRLGMKFSLRLDFAHSGIREISRLVPPRALALGIDQIEQFSAVIISSFLVSGSLSLFNLARTLASLPVILFGVSIGQASLPTLSRLSDHSETQKFLKTLTESILLIAFLTIPASILFIILRVPLVRLTFGAPTLPWLATLTTSKTLALLALSTTFSALIQTISRSFYALHDTKSPLLIGFFSAVFNVLVSLYLSLTLHLGILGIALGWSATAILECFWLLLSLWRRLDGKSGLIFLSLSKMAVAGLATGIGLWVPLRLLDRFVFDTTRTLPLLALTMITSIIGFFVYLVMSYLFKVDELFTFAAFVRRLFKRGNWPVINPLPEPAIPSPDQN